LIGADRKLHFKAARTVFDPTATLASLRPALLSLGPKSSLQSAGEVKSNLNAAFFLPGQFGGVSVPPTADVPCTPHRTPANLAFGDSGHADTTNQCPTRSAEEGNLRGHADWLTKRRGRYGLRRRCDG
jgi:hypothetical protein